MFSEIAAASTQADLDQIGANLRDTYAACEAAANAADGFSQYLQNTAKIADKITVVRSMTHGEAAHERGTHNMFTGYRPSPALAFPSMGSVVSHELGSRNNLPPYVVFNNATLAEMARLAPDSLATLGEISGVGAKKLEAYGREILRVLGG